jgi:hypothetical protein
MKINGFPPIILADFTVAKGDTSRRKPLISKNGMILSNRACALNSIVPEAGTEPPDSSQSNCGI